MPATLVFLESAARLAASLADMAAILGVREAAVARELTKRFEEVRRGTLADLAAQFEAEGAPQAAVPLCAHEVDVMIENALGRVSLKDAVAEVVAMTGLKRRDIYARALEISEGGK